MNRPHPRPEPLSDEAAAHTLKLLHDLTDAFAGLARVWWTPDRRR